MYSVPLFSTAFGRWPLITAVAFSVILTTGCRDHLAPEPVEQIRDRLIEVVRKTTSPKTVAARPGGDSN
jgi:hypothetical protein